MLQKLSSLRNLTIKASDGEIGSVKDSYFDDQRWVLRYIVVDTARWLLAREVLVSPYSVRDIDWQARRLDVSINRDAVRSSPSIDFDKPVSRQQEAAFLDYFNYPHYWGGGMAWGISASPGIGRPKVEREEKPSRQAADEHADPHLRSEQAITGYHIEASDGMIGHIEDFLFDPDTWALRYFIVDTRNWLPGRHVLLDVEWIDAVSWDKRLVSVPLSRDAIHDSPEWNEQALLSADEELWLHQHYGKSMNSRGALGSR